MALLGVYGWDILSTMGHLNFAPAKKKKTITRNKQTNFVTYWHLLIIYHLRTFCINTEEYMENVAPWN